MTQRYCRLRLLSTLGHVLLTAIEPSRNQCWLQEAYVLHDGPPYANGELHIGMSACQLLCAVNKHMQRSVNYVHMMILCHFSICDQHIASIPTVL